MKVVKEILAWLSVIGMLMLISSLPYGWSIYQKVSIFVLGISTGLYFIAGQQWLRLSWDRSKWVFVCLLLLFALLPIRQLFDPTPMTPDAWHQLHLNEWFLYVGLIGMVGFTPKLNVRQVAFVMLATGVVMLLHCLYLYFGTDEFANIPPYLRMDYLRRMHIHSHMVINLYLNIALVFGFIALMAENVRWKRALLISGMVLSWLVILTSNGRIGMVASVLVVSVGLCESLFSTRKFRLLWIVVPCIAAGVWLIVQNPRMTKKTIDFDPRGQVWNYSWRMIKERPITGYGISTMSKDYVEGFYQESAGCEDFMRVIQSEPDFAKQGKTLATHHPHNAFLMYWLAYGIAGLAALLLFFGVAAWMPAGDNRIYLWLILLAVFVQCMTEPIGDHLRPQFIAFMIWICQLTLCSSPQSNLCKKP